MTNQPSSPPPRRPNRDPWRAALGPSVIHPKIHFEADWLALGLAREIGAPDAWAMGLGWGLAVAYDLGADREEMERRLREALGRPKGGDGS